MTRRSRTRTQRIGRETKSQSRTTSPAANPMTARKTAKIARQGREQATADLRGRRGDLLAGLRGPLPQRLGCRPRRRRGRAARAACACSLWRASLRACAFVRPASSPGRSGGLPLPLVAFLPFGRCSSCLLRVLAFVRRGLRLGLVALAPSKPSRSRVRARVAPDGAPRTGASSPGVGLSGDRTRARRLASASDGFGSDGRSSRSGVGRDAFARATCRAVRRAERSAAELGRGSSSRSSLAGSAPVSPSPRSASDSPPPSQRGRFMRGTLPTLDPA